MSLRLNPYLQIPPPLKTKFGTMADINETATIKALIDDYYKNDQGYVQTASGQSKADVIQPYINRMTSATTAVIPINQSGNWSLIKLTGQLLLEEGQAIQRVRQQSLQNPFFVIDIKSDNPEAQDAAYRLLLKQPRKEGQPKYQFFKSTQITQHPTQGSSKTTYHVIAHYRIAALESP